MKKTSLIMLLPLLLCSCGKTPLKFSIHTELQTKMLNDTFDNVNEYAVGLEQLCEPKPVEIDFSNVKDNGPFLFTYGEKGSDKVVKEISTTLKKVSLVNLKIATSYWYKVKLANSDKVVDDGLFDITDNMIRNLAIDSMTNCRDVGGLLTTDGRRTNQGFIYRSGRLDEYNDDGDFVPTISQEGIDTFLNDLHVKTEIDLRGFEVLFDRGAYGSALGEGVKLVWCPMVWTPLDILWHTVNDNAEMIKEVFDVFGDKDNYPVDFHCRIGTDRTGLVAILINAVLGVEEKYIKYDYLFSNFGNIEGPRTLDNYDISYGDFLHEREGNTFQEKVTNYLLEIGVEEADLNVLKEVMLGK